MKKKSAAVIGMLAVCFMMMAAGAAGCGNYAFIPPNGAVVDSNTGLVWLQNANCFGSQDWNQATNSAASLKSGMCGLTDGSMLGHWRLPTKEELVSRQRNLQGFNNVQADYYWSSSNAKHHAWYVGMGSGHVDIVGKDEYAYVWPVRAHKLH